MYENRVTAVFTSCGRLDLLERTMRSFDYYCSHLQIPKIIVEDSADPNVIEEVIRRYGAECKVLSSAEKLGQIQSIDLAYSRVKTPYIFHCEDDWEFHREGFIQDSLSVLETDRTILQVWLRNELLFQEYRFEGDWRETPSGVKYRLVKPERHSDYPNATPGFSFNPGLRRKGDYDVVAPYAHVGHEAEIADLYAQRGFRAAILARSAVTHIGTNRSVLDTTRTKKNTFREMIYATAPPVLLVLFRKLRAIIAARVGSSTKY